MHISALHRFRYEKILYKNMFTTKMNNFMFFIFVTDRCSNGLCSRVEKPLSFTHNRKKRMEQKMRRFFPLSAFL